LSAFKTNMLKRHGVDYIIPMMIAFSAIHNSILIQYCILSIAEINYHMSFNGSNIPGSSIVVLLPSFT